MKISQTPFHYGVAYYPELWDESCIDQDIVHMKETGINCVRIGEFAWHKMEPKQDQIDLSFFKMVITKMHENGIDTVLCTPTPTPPRWLTHEHPETAFVTRDGVRYEHGARQHACTNHPFFRDRSYNIVAAMARELGNLPGVVAWQLDNEFKCHIQECCCETCKGLWHQWLREKYGTIEALNEAWGTEIWSEYYDSFEQIPQPVATPFLHNPSLELNYRLFSMDKINEFAHHQTELIRKYSSVPVTHNTGMSFALDNEKLFEKLDFVSFDTYPPYHKYSHLLFQYDRFRAMKHQPFWLLETSPAHAGHTQGTPSPHPAGFLRSEGVSAVASGALGLNYWLWRQQHAGCEIPHASVLTSWGEPALGYQNVKELGQIFKELGPIAAKAPVAQAEVGLLCSDMAATFFKGEFSFIDYQEQVREIYYQLTDLGIHRDVITDGDDLTRYKVVIVPFLPAVPDEMLERLTKFAENGGILLVGPMTGHRTTEHTVHMDHALGKLEALCGVHVLQFYRADGTDAEIHGFDVTCKPMHWAAPCEALEGTESLASYTTTLHAEASILTRRTVGKGAVYLLGVKADEDDAAPFMKALLNKIADEAGIVYRYPVDRGTLAVPHTDGEEEILFLVNMDGKGAEITLDGAWSCALSGEKVASPVVLEKYGYAVLKKN